MSFEVVAASSPTGCIGCSQKFKWLAYEDLIRFKTILTHVDSKNEQNIIITDKKFYLTEIKDKIILPQMIIVVILQKQDPLIGKCSPNKNILYIDSFKNALSKAYKYGNIKSIFVIGGAVIFRQALNDKRCSRIYLTVSRKEMLCETTVHEFKDLLDGKLNKTFSLVRFRSLSKTSEHRIYERLSLK